MRTIPKSKTVLRSVPEIFTSHSTTIMLTELQAYEKDGVPFWTVAIPIGLVALTGIIPVVLRKKQVEKNSRRPTQEQLDEINKYK